MLFSRLLSKKYKVNRPYILKQLYYYCIVRSLTMTEEQRFRGFENKVLRKIFGAEIKLPESEESYIMLSYVYSSRNIITNHKSRRPRWTGHVPRMEECRSAYKV